MASVYICLNLFISTFHQDLFVLPQKPTSFAYQLSKESNMDNLLYLTQRLRPEILSLFFQTVHLASSSAFKSILKTFLFKQKLTAN